MSFQLPSPCFNFKISFFFFCFETINSHFPILLLQWRHATFTMTQAFNKCVFFPSKPIPLLLFFIRPIISTRLDGISLYDLLHDDYKRQDANEYTKDDGAPVLD